jgi:acetyltransferase
VTIRNLDKIFKPRRVAIIGASDRQGSVGYTLLRNMVGSGFQGVVYPVNAKRESVQGIQAYPDVASLPKTPDLAVVATPAETVPGLVRACGEAGIKGMIVISAGFREAGAAGKALEDQIRAELHNFPGMRIIGPNCLGVIVPAVSMNASFAASMAGDGHIAFISQSGALCTSVLDWAIMENIGFSFFVSIGNMLDVSFADLIDYFGEDAKTRSIIMYAESLTETREFMSASRAFSRSKPIVAYKSGRFAESARAAASHTGALAGEDAVFDAAFQRAGIVRVNDIADIFDCAELLARQRTVRGPRLAIITNAGGPGVMATDALLARGGQLATLTDETIAKLNAFLPTFWSGGNPVDVLGDAPAERFASACDVVLADDGVDAALVILTPQAMTDATGTAQALGTLAAKVRKPILAAWMGGRMVAGGIQVLNQAGVPTYTTPEQGVRAFMFLYEYNRNLEVLYETPRYIPVSFTLDRGRLRDLFNIILMEGHEVLSETLSKALLEAYEIPVTKPSAARSAAEAVDVARRVGYPVVLKVLSPQITHKTDVGGVVLGLETDEAVRAAFEQVTTAARTARPDADVQGVTVQPMFKAANGVELIIGGKKDPTFGAVLMVGMGGTAAEVFRDRALGLPPLNERLARRMLESLKTWPLLTGYRGRPGVDLDKLIATLMRVSYLVADYPEIKEIDLNPLVVTPDTVVALDARVIIDRSLVGQTVRRHSHLAISPYPDEYVQETKLKDGTPVRLRPIRPEDEPLWHEMLAMASERSLFFRFRHVFKGTTHEMATRYCFIDYDREMAIVAVIDRRAEGGPRQIIGVGRMVADPDFETAEYAVFVPDPWQGKGLGMMFTERLVAIAREWGIRRMVAETTKDNQAMIAVFKKHGFHIDAEADDNVVLVSKSLV